MKIVHIIFSLMNGGKENMLIDIVNEQSRMGHSLAIIIINKDVDNSILARIAKGVKVYRLNRLAGSRQPLLPLLRLYLLVQLFFRPAIIHAHDVSIGRIIKRFSSKKVVLTVHGPGINIDSMKFFDRLYFISRSVKEDVEARSSLKGEVIYNGIYTAQIIKKKEFKVDPEFRIIHVKRLNHERKGQDILIKAAAKLIREKGCSKIRVDFVGGGDSHDFLQQLIKEEGVEQEVRLLGNREREWIYKNLCNYHLFAHPSRFEGFGLTVAEAMAARLPVVASNIEGPAEILDKGKYGLLFENEDVNGLANKIEEVIKMYEDGSIREMIYKAHKHCHAHYDIRKTAETYCKQYPV